MTADSMSLEDWLALLKFVADKVSDARRKQYGPQFVKAYAPGVRIPAKIGGEVIGWVSVPKPTQKAVVTDEAKFLAWAKEHAPTEVVTVEQVRPSFAALVLRSVKERGGWLDKSIGEYVPVPGVEVETGEPYARAELSDGAEDVIRRAWRSGDLNLGGLLALPSAQEGTEAA